MKKAWRSPGASHPGGRFEIMSADAAILGRLDCEPLRHSCKHRGRRAFVPIRPESMSQVVLAALRPGRTIHLLRLHITAILKNLAIWPLLGHWDRHARSAVGWRTHQALWSRKTLSRLLAEAGFIHVTFRGVGRLLTFG